MDGRDRHVVVAGPVPRMVLQRPERFPQGIPVARPDPEEQAELARRTDADARPGRSGCSCCHCFLPCTRPALRSGIPYSSAPAADLTFPAAATTCASRTRGAPRGPLWSQARRASSSVAGDLVPPQAARFSSPLLTRVRADATIATLAALLPSAGWQVDRFVVR